MKHLYWINDSVTAGFVLKPLLQHQVEHCVQRLWYLLVDVTWQEENC